MKEKLIELWKCKERYIKGTSSYSDRMIFFSQAYGALEMALIILNDREQEHELILLWNDEWKERLEAKVYEMC